MRRIAMGMIGSALGLLVPISEVGAADARFCRHYADGALKQVRAALAATRCREGLEAARWSADYSAQFDWCRGASLIAAEAERDVRTAYLKQCRAR